jgi:heat-inducible transcriptional repressor
MNARTEKILLAAIEDFIKSGELITSKSLYLNHDFGIKPAMIRWELNKLAKVGYFYQPHPSSGRIPTNKAYKFFIQRLLKAGEKSEEFFNQRYKKDNQILENFIKGDFNAFLEELSNELKILSAIYKVKERFFVANGLSNLLYTLNLWGVDKNEIISIIEDFENLPKKISVFNVNNGFNKIKIIIGKNKLLRSDFLTTVLSCVDFNDDKCLILAIGPKAMNYPHILSLFKLLDKSLN